MAEIFKKLFLIIILMAGEKIITAIVTDIYWVILKKITLFGYVEAKYRILFGTYTE